MCCAYHCSILPDLQVGFSVLVIIGVEVPLPNLTPKLEEGAGVRDGVCLIDPQQEDSQQQTDPQSQSPNSRFHPGHQCSASFERAPGKQLRSHGSWNCLLTLVPSRAGSGSDWGSGKVNGCFSCVESPAEKTLRLSGERRNTRIYTQTGPPTCPPHS